MCVQPDPLNNIYFALHGNILKSFYCLLIMLPDVKYAHVNIDCIVSC